MKPLLSGLLIGAALVSASCALSGGTVTTSEPAEVPVYSFGIVACKVMTQSGCAVPLPGALVQVNSTSGYVLEITDSNGFALFTSILPVSDLKIDAAGYYRLIDTFEPPKIDGENVVYLMRPSVPSATARMQAFGDHR